MALSINEVAAKTGLSSYTLRYYEKEEIIPSVERNSSGHRVFKQEDIEWVNFVTCLKSTGMPISEIREFVKLAQSGNETIGDRINLLSGHKARIVQRMKELEGFLESIEWKINYYKDHRNRLTES